MGLFKQCCCLFMALMVLGYANASVVLSGTRIVFPSNEKEVTVKVMNEGEKPGLVQVWLDKGERDVTPEKVSVPFILTPPLFRLDPHKGQTLRVLMMNKGKLAEDRESLFWLNVLEVPPKHVASSASEEDSGNFMQMAFKTRIKVFYRPSSLNDSGLLSQAFQQLQWHINSDQAKSASVTVKNTSPYHITISRVSVAQLNSKEGMMVAPFDEIVVPMEGSGKLNSGDLVKFVIINDFGGEREVTAQLHT